MLRRDDQYVPLGKQNVGSNYVKLHPKVKTVLRQPIFSLILAETSSMKVGVTP